MKSSGATVVAAEPCLFTKKIGSHPTGVLWLSYREVVISVAINVVGPAEVNLADNGKPLYAWAMVTENAAPRFNHHILQ